MLDGGTRRWARGFPAALALSCLGLVGSFVFLARCGKQSEPRTHSTPATLKSADLAWQEPIEVASGRAHAGPWRMNESEFLYVDDASLAVRDDGAIGVVWVDNEK